MSDALTTLRQALAPKQGMKRIPLPMESYEHPSRPLSAKRLVNLYPEVEPSDARTAAALISTPGLVGGFILPPGPIIAMADDLGEMIYVVSGDHLWRINNTITVGPPTDLGVIGYASGSQYAVTIAVGPTHVVVCVPPNAFYCGHTPLDNAVIPIGGGFPGATSVTYLDGYWVYSTYVGGTARFFISGLLDPTTYDPLDFAYADAFPNAITRVMALRSDIWIVGESGIEIWYDAGAADFPFRRRPGGMIGIPVAHPKSVALGDGSLFWVGRDDAAYRSVGYQPKRISTHAIEQAISDQGAFDVASAFCYTERGHTFYCVTFFREGADDPTTGGLSLVYDCNTEKWHNRASGAGGTGRWRASAAGTYSDDVIFGDYALGGVVWASAPDNGAEGSALATRSFTLPPLWAGTYRGQCHRLEIEMEVGTDTIGQASEVHLEWSDDGGITWTGSRVMSTVSVRGTRHRVFTTRLGSFRQRVFRVTAVGHLAIFAIDCDITGGTAG